MEDNTNNVARAISVALDWTSSPDARRAAVNYLESIKTGDVRFLANTSFILVKRNWSSEIRLHAFKMLQHLVRFRWEELSSEEHRNFANVSVELMSEAADPTEEWALKSQTAALVAEIVRREIHLWQELFPSLFSLASQGPIQAEMVSIMLRWLPEDITVHNEDLEGDRRRLLLRRLTQSLPESLNLLYILLERHFGAALIEVGRQQLDIAKQHANAVTATLNAINAYAEWAPLPDLAKHGIIHGCGFLLSSPDFRLHACEFFKLVSPRKRPNDDSTQEFDLAMTSIFHLMLRFSKEFLQKSASNPAAIDESEVEFAEYISETMLYLGTSNLECLAGDTSVIPLYLEQMLGFFQHFKLAVHYQSLLFWVALLRELTSKPKAKVEDEKKKILVFVNGGMCSAILDISFQRMLKREKVPLGMTHSLGPLELWSDEIEGKGDFGQYRSKLLELVKFVTSYQPLIAAVKVSERVNTIVKSLLVSSTQHQELAVVESMHLVLDNVVSTIFDGSNEIVGGSSEIQLALGMNFGGLLQQLLSLQWSDPSFVRVLGRYLEAFGPFLKYFPDAAGSVINKLFELLTSLPFVEKDPSTSSARLVRLQICTSFIRIAKTADNSVQPHMKGIAETMAQLQTEGRLLRGEHNLLGEAFLIMASVGGVQQQQEVLAWLLEPLSQQWIQPDWQTNYLLEPMGVVQLCFHTPTMWSIFHTVTFFEKALKRSGTRKSLLNPQNNLTATSTPVHPMASHLSWMLPPLLKLLRAIHALWSPSVSQNIPGEIKAAMMMSDIERFSLLGEGNANMTKAPVNSTDGSQFTMIKEGLTEPNETDIRNWLKGIRDSGCNVLGLSTTVGDSFYKCLDVNSVALALVENIQSMEFRHIRLLIHTVFIPLVKNCPPEMWDTWLEKLLHPLFLHSQQALSCSWSSLLSEGRAKVPDAHGIYAGSDLKIEVMEEKILRDLAREFCALLASIASPPLNPGLPSLEHSGHVTRVDTSALKDLNAFASTSMVAFILKHKSLALSALQICLEVFAWTDGEAVTKVTYFCASLVLLAILTDNLELRHFVSKDLFSGLIQGLSLESNAFISADLVGLSREIFVYLSERDPSPRQILLSLPSITQNDMLAFEEALTKSSSSKEQKQHMKSLLVSATGNKLRALAAQKSTNVITNVTARPRGTVNTPETRAESNEPLGLAAIL